MRLLASLLAFAAVAGAIPAAAPLSPQRLRCEYLENPLGIDAAPRLSWIATGEGRGRRQTAYQIIVATDEAGLRAGRGDVWDSGKILSSETSPIAYAGPALGSATRVWWSVRVWDEADQPSAWSAPATWETGLLVRADWHGHWIGRAVDPRAEPTPLLRRAFTLDGKIKRARAYVSGLGYFELTLNGRRVGDHRLDPGYTRYDRRVLYVTHDVTDLLRSGDNAVGVMLGNGWFNVQAKAAWDFDQAPWRATPRFLLELRVELEDGRTVVIASDENWKTSESPIAFSSIYGGENYDARREQPGWDEPGFDDHSWSAAIPVDPPKGKFVAQAMHPIRTTQVIKPVAVTELAPGVFVFDTGQNLTGNAELRLTAPAGTTVALRYGERLDAKGRVDQAAIGRHVLRFDATQQFQTDHYTFKGGSPERWQSRFNYNGFRYVEVTGAPGRLTADNLTINFFHSDVPEAGTFTSSDATLNRIWTNGRWSYLSNLFGIPTDCPHREKNGWTGDAQVACEQGLFYQDGVTVYEKWINDLADEQFITGALPGIVPTSGQWGYAFGSGPAWDSAFLLVPWRLYEYYGDATALKRNYEGYKHYVDYLTARAQDHIVAIGLGDWSPWKSRTPEAITDTSYYYRDAQIVAAVARMLSKDTEAKKYDALADAIRAAFNHKFFDPATASYGPGTQTALGCALFQDLVEPQNRGRVGDRLVAAIASNGNHLDFGFLGSQYVTNALTAHGRADVAFALITNPTAPSYAWQIAQGATTLWENWNGASSQNHTFFGDVNAWMMKTIAGINPDPAAPGFTHILIHPHVVGDLASARGTYESVRGRIASEWTARDGEFRLRVSIPANSSATVFLPTDAPAKATESDQALTAADGVKLLRVEDGCTLIEIGSGDFSFRVAP